MELGDRLTGWLTGWLDALDATSLGEEVKAGKAPWKEQDALMKVQKDIAFRGPQDTA